MVRRHVGARRDKPRPGASALEQSMNWSLPHSLSMLIIGLLATAVSAKANDTSRLQQLLSFRDAQNRQLRDALAVAFCALPANRTWLSVGEYQQSMKKKEQDGSTSYRQWLNLTHGGYCLVPSTHRHFVSPGNPLSVGHKMPESGLLQLINQRLPAGSSVLEIGAGQGPLKAALGRKRPDVNWTAIDGALNVETYTRNLVQYHDVCGPWPVEWEQSFDHAVSIEMAEHISPGCTTHFLNLLRAVARKSVILSWSEQYFAYVHQNAKSNREVISLMRSAGFAYNAQATKESRDLLRTALRFTVMIFDVAPQERPMRLGVSLGTHARQTEALVAAY